MPKRPFAMMPLPGERSTSKPRRAGLTIIVDHGLAPGFQADLLSLAGDYADLANDPHGMDNRFDDAGYARVRKELEDMIRMRPCDMVPRQPQVGMA